MPSFMFAVDFKMFSKLYELAELEDQHVTSVLRKLIKLLPTDGDVLTAIEIFSFQVDVPDHVIMKYIV